MTEFPTYVAMSPDDYRFQRGIGSVSMGSMVDQVRQPGVVGMYGFKPVFIFANAQEKAALESGNVELYFQLRGYTQSIITNEPPEGPKNTIP